MTDVPRSMEPSDAERLATLRASMTHGGAGGISRAVGPVLDRGLVRAIAGDLLGDDSIDATDSKIDEFTITDDATDTFQLTFDPIEDSWNLELRGIRVHRDEFTISGKTLTIVDPADLFLGADTQGTPWDMEIQYDYLTGVPTAAHFAEIVSETYRQVTKGDATVFWPVAYNDSAWTALTTSVVSFGAGTTGGSEDIAWSPANDLQVRATVVAAAGQDVTLSYYVDDGATIYWNGSLIITSGLVGPTTHTIPGSDVLASNILAARAFDTNPSSNALNMQVA